MDTYVNRIINKAFYRKPLTAEEVDYIKRNYTEQNKSLLIKTAAKKKVLPVVAKMMLLLHLDTVYWEEHYLYFKNRNATIMRLIEEIFIAFRRSGVSRICAYENYGAMIAANTDIALYSSGDVDLYADITQKEKITNILEEFGYYSLCDDSSEKGIVTQFSKDDGLIRINIAWKPLIRYSLPIKTDISKYFEWDKMTFYKNTTIRVPSPETLLYLCFLRIAVHGYSRSPDIRLYIDTYNATRNNPDWKQVMAWAKNDGMATKFATVATIAQDLIGIDVPEFVLSYARKDPDSQKILNITYNFEEHTLRYDPSGLQLLKLEAASDNCSVIKLLLQIFFPPSAWLTEYYLAPGEKNIKKYINYYKHLL